MCMPIPLLFLSYDVFDLQYQQLKDGLPFPKGSRLLLVPSQAIAAANWELHVPEAMSGENKK